MGITTRSKAKLAPNQWTVVSLPAKVCGLYFITSDSILDGQTLLWPMAQVMSAFPDQISLLGKFQASSSILCFCTSGWLAYNCAFNKSGILVFYTAIYARLLKFDGSTSRLCFCRSGGLVPNYGFKKSGIMCSLHLFSYYFLCFWQAKVWKKLEVCSQVSLLDQNLCL